VQVVVWRWAAVEWFGEAAKFKVQDLKLVDMKLVNSLLQDVGKNPQVGDLAPKGGTAW
jgi:hypothetical protein